MQMNNRRFSWSEGKMVKMILATALLLMLTACELKFEKKSAPERFFKPEDLLVGEEILPSLWSSSGLVFPSGIDLATKESISEGFGITVNGERSGRALQSVYRYFNEEISARKFAHVYLSPTKQSLVLGNWTYQSQVAKQTHVWCAESPDGSGHLVCEWGAQYEEYIVTFQMRLVPGEATLEDMENVVRAIDLKVSKYLNLHIDSTE